MDHRSVKVAVIGAGVSGLVTARELKREHHNVVVFEQNDRVGGNWIYDPITESDPLCVDPNRETVHSSLYFSLRTNLPRAVMSFMDYPFVRTESDPRTFPGHDEVLRFLDGFASEFGIHELTRFNTRVVRVEPVDGRKEEWVVESVNLTRGSESVTRDVFGAVVVCSGHNSVPKIAEIEGVENYKGYQMHSHNYRVSAPFQDQIVLLVGYGASAFDISADLLPVAKEIHIALKDNPFGVKLEDLIYHDMIKCVNEDGSIVFQDGSSIFADAIIHCTGYKYHFPFLKTIGIVTVEDNCVRPLYKHIFPPTLAPWLSFIGIVTKVIDNNKCSTLFFIYWEKKRRLNYNAKISTEIILFTPFLLAVATNCVNNDYITVLHHNIKNDIKILNNYIEIVGNEMDENSFVYLYMTMLCLDK